MAWPDVASQMRAALLAQFGESVTYEPDPRYGAPVALTGIYNPRHTIASGTAAAGVESLGPAVFFDAASLPSDPELDDPTLIVRGQRYRVAERMPDGMGGILLALRLVS